MKRWSQDSYHSTQRPLLSSASGTQLKNFGVVSPYKAIVPRGSNDPSLAEEAVVGVADESEEALVVHDPLLKEIISSTRGATGHI